MALAVVIIANDFTALSVALPAIERDLDSDLSTVQWVINGYALVFGVLIVTGGRLADMLGRRQVFVAGAGVFAGFSLLGGVAQDDLWLIACRALMGIGGALMWPAILGMTYDVLPRAKAPLAGALIIGAAGFGNAIGPMLGGLLTDELSWRWIFFLNVPIAAFGVAATLASIPADHPAATRDRLDTTGVALLSAGLVCLLLALDQSSDWGWTDARVVGLGALAVVALAAFVAAERRAGPRALVPGDVMACRDFAGACGAVLLMSAVFFAALLYLPQFMTRVLGWSAVRSGVGMLPLMGTFALVSFAAAPLYGRIGAKATVSGGAGCIALGTVLLARLDPGDRYGSLVPGMVVLGAGIGLFYSSVTTAGVTALDPSRTSLAGGIVYMFQIAGGSVGLGLNTAIVTAAGVTGDDLVTGIGRALRLDAVLALTGLAVALVFVGGRLGPVPPAVRRHVHRAHP
jgi:EmrB/QacA subfamily drug resistance transporter